MLQSGACVDLSLQTYSCLVLTVSHVSANSGSNSRTFTELCRLAVGSATELTLRHWIVRTLTLATYSGGTGLGMLQSRSPSSPSDLRWSSIYHGGWANIVQHVGAVMHVGEDMDACMWL